MGAGTPIAGWFISWKIPFLNVSANSWMVYFMEHPLFKCE
jgi:hypothetical protein